MKWPPMKWSVRTARKVLSNVRRSENKSRNGKINNQIAGLAGPSGKLQCMEISSNLHEAQYSIRAGEMFAGFQPHLTIKISVCICMCVISCILYSIYSVYIYVLLGASPSISVRRLELYKLMELYMELSMNLG